MLEKYYIVILVILSPLMCIAGRSMVIYYRRRFERRVAAVEQTRPATLNRA